MAGHVQQQPSWNPIEMWTLFEYHHQKGKKVTFISEETEKGVCILMRRAILSVISHLLRLLMTIWKQPLLRLRQQTCSSDAQQTCRTALQNANVVTAAEIKFSISQQKREGGAPCGSPLNLPVRLQPPNMDKESQKSLLWTLRPV